MYPVSARFCAALLTGHEPIARVEVWSGVGGVLLATVPFTDGQVAFDTKNDQRRQLTLTLTDTDGTWTPDVASDLLAPYGNDLRPYRGIRYLDGTEEWVPLGVFPLTDTSVEWDGSTLPVSVTAPDRAELVQAALATDFYTVAAGVNVATAIHDLIDARVPGLTYNLAPTTFTTSLVVVQPGDDPWKAARALAASAGQELYFDPAGIVRTIDVPDPDAAVVAFDYAEGALNTVTQATRAQTVNGTFNVVLVSGEGPNIVTPVTAIAQDTNPASPTYVGGRIGARVRVVKTDQATTTAQAQAIADAELRRTLGATEQVAFTGVVNPATEGFDVITIEQTAIRASGRYIVDTATIPLLWDQLMQVGTRARSST